jgi:hypothetical protein
MVFSIRVSRSKDIIHYQFVKTINMQTNLQKLDDVFLWNAKRQ